MNFVCLNTIKFLWIKEQNFLVEPGKIPIFGSIFGIRVSKVCVKFKQNILRLKENIEDFLWKFSSNRPIVTACSKHKIKIELKKYRKSKGYKSNRIGRKLYRCRPRYIPLKKQLYPNKYYYKIFLSLNKPWLIIFSKKAFLCLIYTKVNLSAPIYMRIGCSHLPKLF